MLFKFSCSLTGMHALRDTDLPAATQWVDGTKVVFWQRELQDSGKLVRQFCCDVVFEREPPKRVYDTLMALGENRLLLDDPPQEGLPMDSITGGRIIDADGRVKPRYIVPFQLLPREAKPWLSNLYLELTLLPKTIVKTMRWRQSASGRHEPFAVIGFLWSEDGINWRPVPTESRMLVSMLHGLDTSTRALETASYLAKSGASEPLGHELLREAAHLANSAPRSALLIAVSALEAGVASHLTHFIPDAERLVENIPSPPVLKLLEKVIRPIHEERGITTPLFPLKKKTKSYVDDWVALRNKVAHGRGEFVDGEQLVEFIAFVSDFLYLLDACRGHAWALTHIRSDHWREIL